MSNILLLLAEPIRGGMCGEGKGCGSDAVPVRGLVHSERTNEERRETGQRLFGTQTWVALPQAQEESDPAFVHHGAGALPVFEDGGMTVRLIAGHAFGARSPLVTASETLYADIQLVPGASFTVERSVDERALYTISGEIEVAGQTFSPGQLLVPRPGGPDRHPGRGCGAGDAVWLRADGGPALDLVEL